MDPQTAELFIMNHPFTQNLGADQSRVLSGCAQERRIPAGGYLWRQGQLPDALFLVGSGELSLEILIPNEGPLEIETIRGGEAYGEWLEPLMRCDFDVRAVTSVEGVLLPGAGLRGACEADLALGYALSTRWVAVRSERLRRARRKLIEFQGGVIPPLPG
jgi:CRP-like cAMP-binding protein